MKTMKAWLYEFGESQIIKTHDNDRINMRPSDGDKMTAGMFVKLSDFRAMMRIAREVAKEKCDGEYKFGYCSPRDLCQPCLARKLLARKETK